MEIGKRGPRVPYHRRLSFFFFPSFFPGCMLQSGMGMDMGVPAAVSVPLSGKPLRYPGRGRGVIGKHSFRGQGVGLRGQGCW
ncbi:hypothetical protein HOY80DRAFT_530390 [Tuber brumale]|nr:hypothetical protein HOY80DRAFT_530390 [Tuber brumale]